MYTFWAENVTKFQLKSICLSKSFSVRFHMQSHVCLEHFTWKTTKLIVDILLFRQRAIEFEQQTHNFWIKNTGDSELETIKS